MYISDAVASNWMNQDAEINSAIVRRIQRGDLDSDAEIAFKDICRELSKYNVNDMMTGLYHLISSDEQVSRVQKRELLELCNLKITARFLSQTLLYACCQKNKCEYQILVPTPDG